MVVVENVTVVVVIVVVEDDDDDDDDDNDDDDYDEDDVVVLVDVGVKVDVSCPLKVKSLNSRRQLRSLSRKRVAPLGVTFVCAEGKRNTIKTRRCDILKDNA